MKLFADILGCTAETLTLFYLYQYFLKNPKIEQRILIAGYLVDFLFCFTYSSFLHLPFQRIVCSVLFIIAPLILYREKLSLKIIVAVVCFSLQALAELFIKAVLLGYHGDFAAFYAGFEYNYLLGVLMSKTTGFALIYLCTFLFKIWEQKLPVYLYGLLLLVPVSSIAIFYYLQNLVCLVNTKAVYLGYSIITLLLLLFNILFFFLFSKVSQVSWLQTRLAYKKKAIQEQQQYHKNMAVYQQEIRHLHHDMKNHLLILYDALAQNNIAKAKNYVEQQLQLLNQSKMIYTGYLLLDTVLFYKKQLANEQQTKCAIYSELNPELKLTEELRNDFALIVASCLDNALEATAKLTAPQQRWIKVFLRNDQTYIYLQIENSVAENVSLTKQALPSTTKKDTLLHGLGLQQVKRLTEQHQGQLILECENLVFTVELMVKYHSHIKEDANSAQ